MSSPRPSSPHRSADRDGGDRDIRLLVVGRPSFDRNALERFLEGEGLSWRNSANATDAENLIEVAGRLCYLSFGWRQSPKTNREYIRHLIVHEHDSVLEHAAWSFVLTGVSRGFSHQFVRHRVGFAFSQMSQQYVDQRSGTAIMPEAVRGSVAAERHWLDSIERSREDYRELLSLLEGEESDLPPRERLRLVRSAARSLLPEGTETKLLFTANARALRHFLATRGDIEGDEEMRLVCARMLEELRTEAPAVFEDFYAEDLADGLPVVRRVPDGG